MELIFNIIIFIFGLCVGSLLNCLVYRLEKKENFVSGRSHCPKCQHKLGFFDLVPILSFIFLKGRCRYCRQPISFQYPIVEMATGLIFLQIFNSQFSIFNQFSTNQFSNLIYLWIISSILIIVFIFDLKHYLIPEKFLYFGIFFIFFYKIFYTSTLWNSFLGAIGAGLFFFLIWLISSGKWMGFGDVILSFFMGLFLGFPNILPALFSAFFIGAIIGLVLIFSGKKKLGSQVPFGPFLITGTFIALFWGEQLISWYLNLL